MWKAKRFVWERDTRNEWETPTLTLADIFTKCLDKTTFLKLRDVLLTEIG